METNERQRLREFIKYINLSTREFEIKCSISNGYIGKDGNIRNDIRERILSSYPELNRDWLLYGEGEMINEPQSQDTYINKVAENNELVPLVPLHAYAGSLSGFSEQGITLRNCETFTSPISGVDFAIPVDGDSMSPEYPNGSIVLVKKYNPSAFIEWGKVYVLDTCNGAIIKKVDMADEDGKILCISLNPEYKSFKVDMCHIQGWFRVLACLAKK